MSSKVHRFAVATTPKKRQHVYNAIRSYIRAHHLPVGSQMPTTRDLAKQFGISYVTTHSALDDLVREGWLVRHQGKGTFIAQAAGEKKRPQRARLAMVLPPQEDIREAGNLDVVLAFTHGCMSGASASSSELSLESLPSSPQKDDVQRALQSVLHHDGAIFIGDQFWALMVELRKRKFPFVVLASDKDLGPTVNYDQREAVRLAVQHLLEHGYRKIGYLGALEGAYAAKFGHFCEVLAEQGFRLDPALVQSCANGQEAHLAARGFLSRSSLPEAVLVDDYYKAETLVHLSQYHNRRVPENLAVMAYGTQRGGGINPPLSMVEVPATEMGRETALILDGLVRGSRVPERKILQARLALRHSCGCKYSAAKIGRGRPAFAHLS